MELNKKVDQLLEELKSGKFNKVILEGEKLLKKHPDKGYLQNICGLAYQRLNNIKTSIFYFKKAIELDPLNPGQKNNLANSYISLNEYDKAEGIFNEILEKNPNYTAAIVNYARLKNILLDFKKSSLCPSSSLIFTITFKVFSLSATKCFAGNITHESSSSKISPVR